MLKLQIIGHLGKDAIVNTTSNGTSVINFSVAHSETYTDKQGVKQTKTTWVDCSWWKEEHAIVPYLLKGTAVYIEGFPEAKVFEKQDGTTGISLTCRVLMVQLLGGAKKDGEGKTVASTTTTKPAAQAAKPAASTAPTQGFVPVTTPGEPQDDLPF